MTLLFDIGNSRIKWQESHNFIDSPNAFLYSPDNLESQLDRHLVKCDQPDHDVFIVSVAGEDINRQIERWITDRWGVGVHFLHSESKWQTLNNGYEKAEYLGADRWYALIGAVSRYSQPLVVCDIGTAVTIDIVDLTGTHLGGYIIPGVEMMIRSLHRETDIDIKFGPLEFNVDLIPDNTNSAIAEGCLLAIASLINSINKRVGVESTCIMTGGDADKISQLLNSESIVDKNLIFHGIEGAIQAP